MEPDLSRQHADLLHELVDAIGRCGYKVTLEARSEDDQRVQDRLDQSTTPLSPTSSSSDANSDGGSE